MALVFAYSIFYRLHENALDWGSAAEYDGKGSRRVGIHYAAGNGRLELLRYAKRQHRWGSKQIGISSARSIHLYFAKSPTPHRPFSSRFDPPFSTFCPLVSRLSIWQSIVH
jgi:hypothetical protein